jgi:hypothetical protein
MGVSKQLEVVYDSIVSGKVVSMWKLTVSLTS